MGVGAGGSVCEALWRVEALKPDCEVTLITYGCVDLDELNRCYGTDLRPGEYELRTVRMPLGLHRSSIFTGLKGAFFSRYVRRVAPEFDVIISAHNPCDFGVQGIQTVTDFTFMPELNRTMHPVLRGYRRWWYGDSPIRRTYRALCHCVFRPDPAAWRRNVTVSNSDWTRDVLRRELGIESRTLYPPVPGHFLQVPWEQRENGFVCLGQIVPYKRPDAAIRIVDAVRRRGHNVHLHILGELNGSPYARQLKKLADANRDWVFLEGLTYGEKKEKILARHRYGIHASPNEPFGIAPAEMVKAGCVVFVPNRGGQIEIVDHPLLTFSDDEDAVTKIHGVLSSAALRENLREHLATRAREFSVEKFTGSVRQVVFEFLEDKKRASRHGVEGPGVLCAGPESPLP
jgi:glycosyltransferase involved in cell wall biosynthesis